MIDDLSKKRLDNMARYIRACQPEDGTMTATDELLTLDEVAAYLKVSKQYVWRLTRPTQAKGAPIPTVKFGGTVRIRRPDLDAWLLAKRTTSEEK
jgi:excisionase family DNA binding protein